MIDPYEKHIQDEMKKAGAHLPDKSANLDLAALQEEVKRLRQQDCVDNPADIQSELDGDWYCEEHPWALMGHEGCNGAGMPACARVPKMLRMIRFLEQALRERDHQYGFLAELALSAALAEKEG